MNSELWTMLLTSAGLSFVLCILLIPLAKRIGLMDHPSDRKIHRSPVPLVGGVGIYLAMTAIIVYATPLAQETQALLGACALLMVTGIHDDRHELSASIRFILQIVAALIMVYAGGAVLTDFGSLMWDGILYLGWLSVPITVFATLGVINAFNMMDGMDGLSSTIFIIACSALAWTTLQAGQGLNTLLLIIAIGAVFGFILLNARWPWNKRARIFLGDSGSVFLGLFLAWQFIELGSGVNRVITPITAVWLFGIPLADTLRLMARRIRNGQSPFDADQFHLHHVFLKAGFSVRQTWLMIIALLLFTTLIALMGNQYHWPEYWMFYGYILFAIIYERSIHRCWTKGRLFGRVIVAEVPGQ